MLDGFDGDSLLITLDAPTAGILDQTAEQVYDESNQWFLGGENSNFPFPFTTSGGEDVTDIELAGQYYFLRNDLGWRIRSTDEDQEVRWTGNLIPFDLTLPIIVARATRTVLHLGLQPLTTIIATGSGLSVAQDAKLTAIDTKTTYHDKIINNFKELIKISGVWYLIIYDDGEVSGGTEILRKAMKDSAGANISDLTAGVLAAELESTA